MTDPKDIRFTEKKVDESWKEQSVRPPAPPEAKKAIPSAGSENSRSEKITSKVFLNLVTSFGYQVLMHLGDLPHPETNAVAVNLEAAKEMIDLLTVLKEKTEGNLSQDEDRLLTGLVSELQMKYAQKV